jgi:TRAP-type C4-dicarboxylate transport system permease small subunit
VLALIRSQKGKLYPMKKISGLICLVVGGLLLYWGYNMSQAVGSQVNELVTGSPGDKPMLLYIGGAILVLAGLGQLVWKGK